MDESLTQSGFARPSHSVRRFDRLVFVHERDSEGPRTVALGGTLVLGRSGHVEELGAVRDASVSRRHATLDHSGETWTIGDLESRNGTRVGGGRLESPRALVDGDVIRMGDALAVFRSTDVGDLGALEPSGSTLLGVSVEIQRLRGEVGAAAGAGVGVLVLGETGVGKELVGRALHDRSGRGGPLVTLNCAALPAQLAEAELFGHEAGAFTGAKGAREGLYRQADGGTLFLDEIGELSLELQPKLLRALAEGEVRPVGAETPSLVDVRIVAATNRDLEEAVRDGSFRQDLLARLRGWVIRIPPLRQRREDVLPLFHHFLRERRPSMIEPDAVEALLLYGWPSNVRELEQIARVASYQARGEALGREHLTQLEPAEPTAAKPTAPVAHEAPDEDALRAALKSERGNVASIATRFGCDRRTVYRWMESFAIDPSAYRGVSGEALSQALERTGGNVGQAARELGVDRKTVYRLAKRLDVDIDAFRS